MQNPNCFQDVFVFQKLNLLYWRRTDGCWCGEEERKGKKEKILKVTTDSPACVGAGVLTIRCGYRLDRQSLRFTTKVQLPTTWGLRDELLERKNI